MSYHGKDKIHKYLVRVRYIYTMVTVGVIHTMVMVRHIHSVVSVGEESHQYRSKINWSDPEFDQHEPKP